MATRKKYVELKITTALLEQMFRLADTMHIEGAEFDPEGPLVTFKVRAPDAPNGAYAMVPQYYHNGRPDPVFLRSVEWLFPDGLTATTEFGLPEKDAA